MAVNAAPRRGDLAPRQCKHTNKADVVVGGTPHYRWGVGGMVGMIGFLHPPEDGNIKGCAQWTRFGRLYCRHARFHLQTHKDIPGGIDDTPRHYSNAYSLTLQKLPQRQQQSSNNMTGYYSNSTARALSQGIAKADSSDSSFQKTITSRNYPVLAPSRLYLISATHSFEPQIGLSEIEESCFNRT